MPPRLIMGLLAGVSLAASAVPVTAQPRPAAAPAVKATQPEPVDESALRYYAGLKQTARVEAEIRRLRRLHPDWRPPADLGEEQPGAEDEAPLWELLSADRLSELRAAITARQKSDPRWQPSAKLARQMRRRELRLRITAAASEGKWDEVAELAVSRRGDLDPSDVQLSWTVAEAFGKTERAGDAALVLRGIIEAPGSTRAERLATIHSALALLTMKEADELIAAVEAREGAAALESVALDITRARLAAFLKDQPCREATPAELDAFHAYAKEAPDASQAGLVAWYHFKRRDWVPALEWFKSAIARGGDAMVAHGLAHTLRKLGFKREAEEVAYAWREPLVNNLLLFIDLMEVELTAENAPPIETDRIKRLAEVTLATTSGEGAQGLAWYAYNTCQFETALEWFQRAVAWFPKEATVQGYAVTLKRLGKQKEFIEVVNRYDGLFPKVVDLVWGVSDPKLMPCETAAAKASAPAGMSASAEGRYYDLTSPQQRAADGLKAASWSRVPQPSDSRLGATPLVKKSEFPVAVSPENDLRFLSTAASTVRLAGGRWRDRQVAPAPLVARRVLGAGPMAYERYGFALLPAYTGETSATSPTAAERAAPAGTVWAEETAAIAPEAIARREASRRPDEPGPASSRFLR